MLNFCIEETIMGTEMNSQKGQSVEYVHAVKW